MSPTVPEPTDTAALLVNDRGQYLLHLRDYIPGIWQPGRWSLLGGGREPDESLDEAVARELWEEAGLIVPDLAPYTTVETSGPEGQTVRIQVYAGRWNGDPASLTLTEGVMLHWFDADVMPRLTMCPATEDVVRRHRSEHPCPDGTSGRRAGASAEPNIIGVHLYLEDAEGRVLLGLRHPDSAYAGSHHHFLAGHCEQESALACLVREAQEEAGLVIEPGDVEFAHAVHLVDSPGTQPRMQMVFRARRWRGRPEVREPDKCLGWGWWPADALPEPIVPYARAAIDGIRAGRLYTELGWT